MTNTSNGVKERVIAAAEGLFAELGYQGCSLLKIAKAAGTSESGVLRFFDSKEEVFLSVIENALADLHQRIERAYAALQPPAAEDAVERLLTLLKVVFKLYAERPERAALIFSEGGMSIQMLRGSEGKTVMTLPGMTALVDLVTAQFAAGIKQGRFRGIDPVAAREVYFGMLEGTILGWLLSSEGGAYKSATEKKVLTVVRKMLGGLAAE